MIGCGRQRLNPSSESAASGSAAGLLAHQTSHSDPSTGIFRTTSKKKMGQNPSTAVILAAAVLAAALAGEAPLGVY